MNAKYKSLSEEYKRLDQKYITQINSQHNENISTLNSMNAKLMKEN